MYWNQDNGSNTYIDSGWIVTLDVLKYYMNT